MEMFQETNEGISFKVKVIPKASRSKVVGWENGELRVRLAAAPEKGEANVELLRYLAETFGMGKRAVRLMRGKTSRHKQICVVGISTEQFQEKLKREIEG